MNSSLSKTANMIYIYIRSYNKRAVCLPLKSPLSGKQLIEKVKAKSISEASHYLLFFKGKVIQNNQTQISFQPKSIVHLVDMARVNLASISLTFKVHSNPTQVVCATVTPQTVIRDVLREQIKPVIGRGETQVFLVYLGKPINIFKKFEEEFIENQSQILIVDFKRKTNTELSKTHISIANTQHGETPPDINQTQKFGSPAMGARPLEELEQIKATKQALIASKSGFQGFNPHPSPNAPNDTPSAAPGGAFEKKYEGNLKEVSPAPPQNPEHGGPTTSIGDTIFSAEDELPETQNFTSEAAKEVKASLKKSKGK